MVRPRRGRVHPRIVETCALRGVVVRVGIDQAFGGWNAPVDPDTHEFVYVPIRDRDLRPTFATRYASITDALGTFANARVILTS